MRTRAISEEWLRNLNETGEQLNLADNIPQLNEVIRKQAQPLFNGSRFQLYTLDNEKQKLIGIIDTENNRDNPLVELPLTRHDSLPVWCAVNKRSLLINDIEVQTENYNDDTIANDISRPSGSIACCPLLTDNSVYGIITIQNSQKNYFERLDALCLETLCRMASSAISKINLTEQTKQSVVELEKARTLLVESERMAALGQLTAGIAHEIKNPLNFVNNFSELTIELAGELSQALDKLNNQLKTEDKTYLDEIAGDIYSNALKINEHGKRADSIIKGMLLHARGQHAELLPTDINALLAEYVNLGYHGMRAQDPGFNIKIESEYDQTIAMINAIPQNLSRVFLNLINNACYSTNKKKIELKDTYFPVLTIKTKNMTADIEIRIRDNGFGIPQSVMEKVFNPFFTTKPPGQGTGLGLSLSYDIIAKEHHGTMRVESVEGEYAEFIITIPKNLK